MSAIALPVCFALDMPKKRETKQLGQRIDAALAKRVEDFTVRHPMQPSIAKILELALTEWLDKHEPELPTPDAAKRKPR